MKRQDHSRFNQPDGNYLRSLDYAEAAKATNEPPPHPGRSHRLELAIGVLILAVFFGWAALAFLF